jgi:alkaline phosphatase D
MSRTPRLSLLSLTLLISIVSALALAPGAGAAAKGFKYGVAAGDVSQSSAILWARANKAGPALIQLGKFNGCNLKQAPGRLKAQATKGKDLTVQKKVTGLKAGKTYRYRFCMAGGKHSSTGTFKTPPKPSQAKTIHFAVTGDQDALPKPGEKKPFWNNFQIWKLIKAEKNDFNVMMGDTIYSDTEVPGYGKKDVATTVKKKWAKYRINLAQKNWTNARGAASYYAHWDDHEFINDFSPFENSFPLGVGTVNINGKTLYKRGVEAFRDYNPITYSKKNGIYRTFRWGKNLQIFLLDERSFRSTSADYGGTCDNPPGSGNPDLAPTAPQSTRNVFALIVPQLANPVPPGCLAKINDPSRTMLGKAQLSKFEKAIKGSKATFKVIMNEVPIQQYYSLPYDRWEGYAAEREKLLHFLHDNVKNVVFMTTDVHANLVNDARFQTLEAGGPQDSGILDVTTGPVATKTYTGEINDATGNSSGGTLVQGLFFKPPPPNGVGMQCAATDQFSYAEATVTKKQLRIELKDIKGNPVRDTGDRNNTSAPPCATVAINKK